MKLVFCGTPAFAVPTLEAAIAAGHEVSLVLTQPDRPAGRRMEVQQSPVKRVALQHGLPVVQPERLRTNEALQTQLAALAPEAILVVAYGRIIPDWMLHLPRYGNLNLHGSLLPKYRGAAPIQWAVANGEHETGVSTMRLDAGLDTGDVLLQQAVAVDPEMTAEALYPRLAALGAELTMRTLEGLAAGTLPATRQDHTAATLAPILTREDGALLLDQRPATVVYNRWRGFYPWPGAHATLRGKRFLVHRMRPCPAALAGAPSPGPGELMLQGTDLLAGAAGYSAVVLDEVQLEGKPRMAGAEFARNFQLRPGERLA